MLDELEYHLTDKHLHIIAPPGSGKTVLGLEVAIRLNKPVLILAPTIAIRNQWIQRFCELFLQTHSVPDWISRDIRNPKFMTVVTYQGLHAACNNEKIEEEDIDDEEEENEEEENKRTKATKSSLNKIAAGLKAQNVQTIVVDEAHHLKNEWWQTLTGVKEQLDTTIVGLTATPPYDVTVSEWKRYIDLNGPVDTEISVPELVLEGDLCPHQDYVYFTLPTEKERVRIVDFRGNMKTLFGEIKEDETLVRAIEQHPIWQDPRKELDWIYNNLSYYSACLIFLNANKREIPQIQLEVVGDKKFKIPTLDYDWLAVLLDFYLYKNKDYFEEFEEHKKKLENRLRRYGAIERKQISFTHNKRITGLLSSSVSKIKGIKDIVDFEYRQLKSELRLVILCDFIRKEFFVNESTNTLELNKIGVIPIFEQLRRHNKENKKIAVLTGSMIIIPASAYNAFKAKATKHNITQINFTSVPFDSDYVQIHQTEKLRHDIVHIITQVFEEGGIEVLVGTKSLLGEGWDAPAINSLILASFVGSFVLSNQMRGRAIRTQKGNQEKTGNIWHLACVDATSSTGGKDLDLLKRRFRSFVGVSFKDQPSIENGIDRLNLPAKIRKKAEIQKKNEEMLFYAGDRENLKQRWVEALQGGVNLVEEIKVPFSEKKKYKKVKMIYYAKTIANLSATLVSGAFDFFVHGISEAFGQGFIQKVEEFYVVFSILGVLGVLFFGKLTIQTLYLSLKYRDISKDIRQIGKALLHSLVETKVIRTENSKLRVKTSVEPDGAVFCHLEGGTTFERSAFINAMKEIIAPVENPRYVLIRKNKWLFFKQKDYHSVPEILGQNKKQANAFKKQWKRFVGNCNLIFTRTITGRKLLLKSRIESLSAQFEDRIEHVNKWK